MKRMIKTRKIKWAGHVACVWRRRKKKKIAYRILVEKPEGKAHQGT
jgi:hypothetical protein